MMKKLLCTLSLILGFSASTIAQIPKQLEYKYDQLSWENENLIKVKAVDDLLILEDLQFLAQGLFNALKSSYGTQFDLMADQITSTNNVRNFWQLAEEPRIPISNEPTSRFDGPERFFDQLTRSQRQINNMLIQLEDSNKTFIYQARDLTSAMNANLHFLRGLSKSYQALIYDQGAVLEEYIEGEISFNPLDRSIVFQSGYEDLNEAISIAESLADEDYEWLLLDSNYAIDRANFIKMVHSFAAKVLISFPKNKMESYSANQVLQHAEAGLDSSFPHIIFNTINSNGTFADYYSDWSNFLVSCNNGLFDLSNCSGYLPIDVKAMHLLNDDYPSSYPRENAKGSTADYPENTSNDPRLAYFQYTTNAGFLNSSRDPELFSNYFSIRGYSENDWWKESNPVIHISNAELQYIKAEAYAKLGNLSKVNEVLQASPYGTLAADFSPDLPSVQSGYFDADGYAFNGPTTTLDDVTNVLHKEYSIEIGTFTSIGTHWFFMRRNGLLQELSAELWPIPYERFSISPYTFGGLKLGSPHEDAWHESYYLPKVENLEVLIQSKSAILTWDAYDYRKEITTIYVSDEAEETEFFLDANANTVTINGLDNNTTYSFDVVVFNDTQESKDNEVSFTPNLFGAPTTLTFDTQEEDVVQNQSIATSLQITNYEENEITVSSIDISLQNEDEFVYENYLDFYSLNENSFTVQSGETREVILNLRSPLWGSLPTVELNFNNFASEFKVLVQPPNIDLDKEPTTNQNYWYSAPDSIAFGDVEEGVKDSAWISLKNMNIRSMIIDTLYIDSFDDDGNSFPSPVFSFKHKPDSVIIKPFDTYNNWLYAEPSVDIPHIANAYWGPRYWGSSIIGRYTVNNGERMISSVKFEEIPELYELSQNYPNPFNPSTNIRFSIPQASDVQLEVFNLLGQKVQTLVSGKLNAGMHTVNFDASSLSSGVYLYRIRAGNFVQTKRMLLIK
jgi:hypothetical protein